MGGGGKPAQTKGCGNRTGQDGGVMPRGGSGKADDYSPYKTADGRELKLLKSSRSSTGYLNIVKLHENKYYPKKKLDEEKGSKVMKVLHTPHPAIPPCFARPLHSLSHTVFTTANATAHAATAGPVQVFGKGQGTAREAAIKLAEYLDSPTELPKAAPRQPYGSSKKSMDDAIERKHERLDELRAEAEALLESMDPPEVQAERTRARFEVRGAAADAPTLTVMCEDVGPPPVVPAKPATVFDPDVLAKVARIKASNGMHGAGL